MLSKKYTFLLYCAGMQPEQVSPVINDFDMYKYALLITNLKAKFNFHNVLSLDANCIMAVTVKKGDDVL